MYENIIINTNPTEKCIGWINTGDKWKSIDNIFSNDIIEYCFYSNNNIFINKTR